MPDVPARGARNTRARKRAAIATQAIEGPVQRPAVDMTALFRGQYLSLTSFKRDGSGGATPMWFVSDARRLFARTDERGAQVETAAL